MSIKSIEQALQQEVDRLIAERDKLTAELASLRDSGVELPSWTLLHRQWPDSYWYGEIYGYTESQLRDYGDRRAMAERERCDHKIGEFAKKWWSIHCASNKHMETTRTAHDDFCALQVAIRKGETA